MRAVSRPYPGAFTYYQGIKLIVWRAHPVGGAQGEELGDATAGTIVAIRDQRPIVRTASGLLMLTDFDLAAGPAIALAVGDRLG